MDGRILRGYSSLTHCAPPLQPLWRSRANGINLYGVHDLHFSNDGTLPGILQPPLISGRSPGSRHIEFSEPTDEPTIASNRHLQQSQGREIPEYRLREGGDGVVTQGPILTDVEGMRRTDQRRPTSLLRMALFHRALPFTRHSLTLYRYTFQSTRVFSTAFSSARFPYRQNQYVQLKQLPYYGSSNIQ